MLSERNAYIIIIIFKTKKVATIPDCPEDINIYLLSFPFGTSVYRVPKNEFYVITAAFGEFDLYKEASGILCMNIYKYIYIIS